MNGNFWILCELGTFHSCVWTMRRCFLIHVYREEWFFFKINFHIYWFCCLTYLLRHSYQFFIERVDCCFKRGIDELCSQFNDFWNLFVVFSPCYLFIMLCILFCIEKANI